MSLTKRLLEHRKWLQGKGGNRFRESGTSLACVRFAERVMLRNADLACADLVAAWMVRADLRYANLMGADLRAADLTRAYLPDSDLSGTDLRCADLTGANLTGAKVDGLRLEGAKLSGATTLPDGRTYDAWRRAPLANLITGPEAVAFAIKVWGDTDWFEHPLEPHIAWAPAILRDTFIALHEAGLLPAPRAAVAS